MKIHEPDWAGEVLRCEKCSARFTLEANDEDLVHFIETMENGNARYWIDCPKCKESVVFQVDINRQSIPPDGLMPAPFQQ